jgi:hypothetical protein
MYRAPTVGGDLFDTGRALRTCDNTYRYPAGGSDEAHALGQAWAGFAWQVRAGLVAALSEASNDAAARALIAVVAQRAAHPRRCARCSCATTMTATSATAPHYDLLHAAAEAPRLGFDRRARSRARPGRGSDRPRAVADRDRPGLDRARWHAARPTSCAGRRGPDRATFAAGALLPAPTQAPLATSR